MIKVGITGGIGSGKSTIVGILEGLGASVIDADQVSRDLYQPDKDGFSAVVDMFGPEIVDVHGNINRQALGKIVFANESARRRLEGAVWPLMEREFHQRFDCGEQTGAEVIFLEAAILIEAGWDALMDEIWVVIAGKSRVMDRLRERDGFDEQQVADRLNAQLADAQKIELASAVFENDGSVGSLRETVTQAWSEILERSRK